MRVALIEVNSVLSLPMLLVGEGKPSADIPVPVLGALKETRELLWRSAGVAAMFGEETPDADTPDTSDAAGEPETAERMAVIHALRSACVSAFSLMMVLSRNLITRMLPSCLSAAPSNGIILRAGSPSCAVNLGVK